MGARFFFFEIFDSLVDFLMEENIAAACWCGGALLLVTDEQGVKPFYLALTERPGLISEGGLRRNTVVLGLRPWI